ncbi:MAG: XRE family transcriptional regulator [Flavobacteriales bacterium]|jgi:predicted DNA-binding mobile mystery protein A|nr:XRE family transcriptional regulator [Flavobacteriales bacterium]MBT5750033.1 XRE family transcriptional regulator [Flavobacteriales bacterium]
MKSSRVQFFLDEMQKKLNPFSVLKSEIKPDNGWVNAIRVSIKMSLRQLGERLHITPQGVRDLEKREKEGAITINALKEVGRVLDMDLVYGFISRHNSLEAMIEERARDIAEEVILKSKQTTQLNKLRKSDNDIKKAIQQKTYEISSKMPSNLWD